MLLTLSTASGRTLDATVEVHGNVIVIHSRSGGGANARNPDYRPAVETILARLAAAGADPDVYLDSQPVQHLPLDARRLATAASLSGTVQQRFDALVRAMNAGSASNGAYRRIRLEVPQLSGTTLVEVLRGDAASSSSVERLPYEQLRRVRSHQVRHAVALLRQGEPHNFAESKDFDLVTPEGEHFPPKAVFGLALKQALGFDIFPGHFSAGLGTPCFTILEEAGYAIVPKGHAAGSPGGREPPAIPQDKHAPGSGSPSPDEIPVTEEERSWIEGNPAVAVHLRRERAAGLAKAKKAAFIAEHGKLFCEHCAMDPVAKYGPLHGPACIEVHHAAVQVADMDAGHATKLADLQCLCANCHRILHRRIASA